MNTEVIGAEEIINAYNKHKEDFLIIDLNNFKEYGMKTVKYFDIKIKKADGKIIVPYIKFIKLLSAGRIKPADDRTYEKLKIAIRRDDEANPESLFGKAMELICEHFTKKVKQMKDEGIINDDEYDDNNNPNVIIVPNCKSQTPLQKFAKDKDGVKKVFDNPMLWFGLNYKAYKSDEEKNLKRMDFSYKSSADFKFIVKNFDVDIYDNDNVINHMPQIAMVDDEIINNLTVDKFITIRSQLSGLVYMQVKASKQSFNLNTKIVKSLYVKSNKSNRNAAHLFNQDELNDIMGVSNTESKPSPIIETMKVTETPVSEVKANINDNYEDGDDGNDNDDGDSSINDEINNLKFS